MMEPSGQPDAPTQHAPTGNLEAGTRWPASPRGDGLSGVRIRKTSEHAVLLFHGLGGSPAEMLYLRRTLQRKGFHVELPVLPGHCAHYSQLRKLKWQDFASAAQAEFEKVSARYSTVSVSGLCMGAVLALYLGIRNGCRIKSICPISTTLHFDGWGLPWTTCLIPYAVYTPLYFLYNVKESHPYGVKDENIRRWIKSKMCASSKTHYSKIPFRSICEMRQMNHYVRKHLDKITAPICAIHPLDDEVSSLRSLKDIQAGASSRVFESLILEDSYHLATVDREKALVAGTIADFLERIQ
ncbi:MAG: alpha/beta hydrolase [Planctomycetes bacterium]|nr:alpha/beta hydrolase [Planctomycetota bacterium]